MAIFPVLYHSFKVPIFFKSQIQIPPPQIPFFPIQMEFNLSCSRKVYNTRLVSPIKAFATTALLMSLSFPVKYEHIKSIDWHVFSPHILFNNDRVFYAVNVLRKSLFNWIKSESRGLVLALFPPQELNLMGFYSRLPTWSPRRNCWPWTRTRRTCSLSMRLHGAPSMAPWRTSCSLEELLWLSRRVGIWRTKKWKESILTPLSLPLWSFSQALPASHP